jgi:hypothetical protein
MMSDGLLVLDGKMEKDYTAFWGDFEQKSDERSIYGGHLDNILSFLHITSPKEDANSALLLPLLPKCSCEAAMDGLVGCQSFACGA